jgi:hypothetical protein
MSTWTPMTERRPTEADLPIWLMTPANYVLIDDAGDLEAYLSGRWTHWQAIAKPEPPERPPTQNERDEKAFLGWVLDPAQADGSYSKTTWLAALAYRDAENRKDLGALNGITWDRDPIEHISGNMYRARKAYDVDETALQRLRQRAGIHT